MIALDENRLKLAKELGDRHTLNSSTTGVEKAVK